MTPGLKIYIVTVLSLGTLALFYSLYRLYGTRLRREQNIENRERFDAIFTRSPIENPEERAKRRALRSIENQYTIVRRLLVPLIIIITAVLGFLPFIPTIPASLISLFVAAITVLVGITVRPMAENAISGLVISASKIINIGDTVKIGELYGTVEDITMTHTTIKIWDWRRYVIPNSRMLQLEFLNYSLNDKYQWANVRFWVDYASDMALVEKIAIAAPKTSKHCSFTEDPSFCVIGTEKEAIECWVAAWAETPSDAWMLSHETRRELIKQFQQHGITTLRYRAEIGANQAEHLSTKTNPI